MCQRGREEERDQQCESGKERSRRVRAFPPSVSSVLAC